MSGNPVDFTISTDTIDDAALTRAIEALRNAIEALRNAIKEQHGLRFIPGMAPETTEGTPVDMPMFQHRCALSMPEGVEEYTDEYDWPEAQTAWDAISGRLVVRAVVATEPLTLLPYCDACCRPLTATRDEPAQTTVLVCKRCGERQRVTDRDYVDRLSAADFERLLEMVARARG